MLKRAREFLRSFDKEVLERSATQAVQPSRSELRSRFDYKGQRRDAAAGEMGALSPEQLARLRDNTVPDMQPRKIRLKNAGYLALFLLWNVAAIAFVMNRVGGDDLARLQAEAEERIRIAKRGEKVSNAAEPR